MTDAIAELTAMVDLEDPFLVTRDELEPLWIDAINQRLQRCRPRIGLLDQLASDAGVDEIKTLDDVVPLLFAHTAYKSYPESFIDKGQWDRMNLWLDTLSKHPVEGVDLEGVADADDGSLASTRPGTYTFATSGTSGKKSFLDQAAADVDFGFRTTIPRGMSTHERRAIFESESDS